MSKIDQTLKSRDTEENIDIYFTRPIGLMWARLFNRFDIHPNTVTVLSMILGAMAGFCFVHDSFRINGMTGLMWNIAGVILLMWANFYDSADGQLARMSGKCSRLGRILDGASSDIWYICIYVCLAFRIYNQNIPGTEWHWGIWAFVVFAVEGLLCHADECRKADYIRNAHLMFLGLRNELDSYQEQKRLFGEMSWKKQPIEKFFQAFYVNYMRAQENETPQFQRLMTLIRSRYGDSIPQWVRDEYRQGSFPLLKWTNFLTFNWRAFALYAACLLDMIWLLMVVEIFIFTLVMLQMHYRHEGMCRRLAERLEKE